MRLRLRAGFGLCVAAGLAMNAVPACGTNPPAYAITATDVTMPTSGNGETQYKVSGIPSTGTLLVSCQYSGPQTTTAKIPVCGGGPIFQWQVTAGQTVAGTIGFIPYGNAVPVSARRGHGPAGG